MTEVFGICSHLSHLFPLGVSPRNIPESHGLLALVPTFLTPYAGEAVFSVREFFIFKNKNKFLERNHLARIRRARNWAQLPNFPVIPVACVGTPVVGTGGTGGNKSRKAK
jgi:hypothetical protein